jgi:mitochondrial fission protein ELM1
LSDTGHDGKPARRILILSDGRPGHYRQSEGVAAALARRGPITVARAETGARLRPLARLWRQLAGRRATAALALRLGATGPSPEALNEHPDLIVSAGGATMIANMALARLTGAPNLFCGTLRGAPPEAFSAVLIHYAALADRPRHILSLKPSPLDPDALPAPIPWRAAETPRLAALIGGDSGTHRYAAEDWRRLAALLDGSAWPRRVALAATSSPRTPAAAEAALAGAPGLDLLRFAEAGAGSIEALIGRSDAILATGDSASMVSEAVAARRPVVVVEPADRRAAGGDEAMLRAFEAEGRIARLPLAHATPVALDAALATLTPMAENHLDVLARRLGAAIGWR